MYIPTSTRTLENDMPQIRLGLQGEPGSGKTFSALTFPNPIVLNCDRGLTAFAGRKDIIEVPVWDNDFIRDTPVNGKKFGDTNVQAQIPNKRDWILHWLKYEGLKLQPGQTLIIDSWTRLQDFFDAEQNLVITNNDYLFWEEKINYSVKVMEYLCSMKCHVVACFHELKTRDPKTGQLLDKIQPLQQGKFVAKIKLFFSDYFRMYDKPKMVNNEEVSTEYLWQVKSTSNFDAKTRLKVPDGTIYVKPNFEVFKEYGIKEKHSAFIDPATAKLDAAVHKGKA